METEITILMLVGITFLAGIVGGLVIAEATDTYDNDRQRRRKQRRKERQQRRRMASYPSPRRG